MNEFLATHPFDLYQLRLFRLVVKHQSFTAAANEVGLTQSAITRQIQSVERSLGIELLERTTRSVRPTAAGEYLMGESNSLIGGVDACVKRLKDGFGVEPSDINVGFSRSISHAHLTGLFHGNLHRCPDITYHAECGSTSDLLQRLEANSIDVVVTSKPSKLPSNVAVTHSFKDSFTWIAPIDLAEDFGGISVRAKQRQRAWLERQSYLALDSGSNTGRMILNWSKRSGLKLRATMELDSFDQIISFGVMGMGIACVPQRALSNHSRRGKLKKLKFGPRFERSIVVLIRKQRRTPDYIARFVENVLF